MTYVYLLWSVTENGSRVMSATMDWELAQSWASQLNSGNFDNDAEVEPVLLEDDSEVIEELERRKRVITARFKDMAEELGGIVRDN